MDCAAGANVDGGDRDTTSFTNACLDVFLLDDAAPPQRLLDLLAAAWDHDALTTLKLVCHRRTVKRDTEGFFAAVTWVLQTHPRVFRDNLPAFAELGYVHDLAALLERLLHDAAPAEEATPFNIQPAPAPAGAEEAIPFNIQPAPAPAPAGLKHARDDDDPADLPPETTYPASPVLLLPIAKRARHDDPASAVLPTLAEPGGPVPPSPAAVADPGGPASAVLLSLAESGGPVPPSPAVVADTGGPASATTENDLAYRTLFEAIVDFFVDRLHSDMDRLKDGNTPSLAAHWCPKMGSPGEQTTLLREHIARGLFPDKEPKYMLSYLRHKIDRLVSVLGKQKQQSPEQKKVGHKLPHFITDKFGQAGMEEEVIEEWRTMVADLRAKGCFNNCIAVCNVSPGVLNSKQLKVCVALGLMMSENSEDPWKHWVHGFSTVGDARASLRSSMNYTDKLRDIQSLETFCDSKFNLKNVFEWILTRAIAYKVKPENMVEKIFVFTGEEFEHAIVPPRHIQRPEELAPQNFNPSDVRRWSDDYRIMCERFKEHGYDDRVPGVVFWNLRGERSAALTTSSEHAGVLTLSGYSDNLLRLFLEKGGVVDADDEMTDAISGEEYQKLEVRE